MSTRAPANLANTRLAEIAETTRRLEEEAAQIRASEANAANERRQRAIDAALDSVALTLEPAKAEFDAAESELTEAVSKIAELARARDAAAERLKNATRQARFTLSSAGVLNEQINKATAGYESNRRAVAFLSSRISGARSLDDALLEVERRTHWTGYNDAGSLVIVITRKAG
ncbi:MAG TPA: hypothetical protein VKA60_21010 [Blastocatellia bacterium]|nr:hypothetical protein [Blastocatellia bacterium]